MKTIGLTHLAWCAALGVLLAGCAQTTPHAAPAAPPLPVPTRTPPPTATPLALLPVETPPADAAAEFTTDFRKHIVPYVAILSGGPPKDGIPAIDHPAFIGVRAANSWLAPTEPVIALQIGRDARAYPVRVLVWHEIVNDTVGGVPVAVTYCPLCNTAIAFERRVHGRVLDFGTTGRLHYSNLVMYDRQTESWWQQATGQSIAGAFTGTQLTYRSAPLMS